MSVNQIFPNLLGDRDIVLAIDSSTTACKALLIHKTGKLISEGHFLHETKHPTVQTHEQSAEGWWDSFCLAVRSATKNQNMKRLACLCITHQRETFVAVDELGNPLRDGILWMDERARQLLSIYEKAIGNEKFQKITGKPLTGNLTFGKIAWMRKFEPEIFSRTHKFLDVQAYLVFRLTGEFKTGQGSADPTGLFDLEAGTWSKELLDLLGITRNQLPDVIPGGEYLGSVMKPAGAEANLPDGLPIISGIGDGQCGGLGANVFLPQKAYLSLGTSVITGVNMKKYRTDQLYRTLFSGFPDNFVAETALLGGAFTVSWFFDEFLLHNQDYKNSSDPWMNCLSKSRIEDYAAKLPPGADGLILVPYWNSAMSPYWDAAASGIVMGWRGYHTTAHLYRAILEGIGMEILLHIEGLKKATQNSLKQLITFGGGAQNHQWCQIIANITGLEIIKPTFEETTALGAGILGASGTGLFPDVKSAANHMVDYLPEKIVPDPLIHDEYQEIFNEVYKPLFPAVQLIQKNLATIVDKQSFPVK